MDWTAIIAGVVCGLVSALANHGLTAWRLSRIEERLEPLDVGPTNVLTRLARLESRRAH